MTTVPGPFILGVDLGKASDHTALVLAEPKGGPRKTYDLTHIERVDLRTRYTDVAQHVKTIVAELTKSVPVDIGRAVPSPTGLPLREVAMRKPHTTVVLDYTGVGIAVAEIFLAAQIGCSIVLLTITGGSKVTVDEIGVHVPKTDLVSVVQRVLQEERVRIPADDPASDLLVTELGDFQAIIRPSGHVSYEASTDWRSGKHDDLVLAAALALWWGESKPTVGIY